METIQHYEIGALATPTTHSTVYTASECKQDQGSKGPSASPFHQLKFELSMDIQVFVCIPRVQELLKS